MYASAQAPFGARVHVSSTGTSAATCTARSTAALRQRASFSTTNALKNKVTRGGSTRRRTVVVRAEKVVGIDLGTTNSAVSPQPGKLARAHTCLCSGALPYQ